MATAEEPKAINKKITSTFSFFWSLSFKAIVPNKKSQIKKK